MKSPDSKAPFFARFLEGQDFPRVHSEECAGKKPGGGGGPPFVTLKYPSDDDEIFVTLKYPSDSDESLV